MKRLTDKNKRTAKGNKTKLAGCVFPRYSFDTTVWAKEIKTVRQQTKEAQSAMSDLADLDLTADKSVLKEMIRQAEQLDLSGYDETAAAFLTSAIASAKQVEADANATQSMTDKHIQLLQAVSGALYEKTDPNVVYDGTYEITGALRHATSEQDSMGNAALKKPFQIIKSGDTIRLRMECVPLTTKLGTTKFTGYLAGFWYFPDADPEDLPEAAAVSDVEVEAYYDVYDSYNDPKKGTDANVKGQKYPHYIAFPIELNQTFLWTQVYVPVMESISEGSGRQYARLLLDWNTLKQISGQKTDKSSLENAVSQAESLLGSLQKNSDGFAGEQLEMLSRAIASGKAAFANLNVDQTITDSQTDAVIKAVNACTRTKVNTDKSELKKAIQSADSYLNETDVTYGAEGLSLLREARDRAEQVYNYPEATQTQVNLCVKAINSAIESLQIEGTDKRALKKALDQAKSVLEDKQSYTAAAYQVLETAYREAKAAYDDKEVDQETADSKTMILNYVVENLKKVTEINTDRSGLYNMIKIASHMTGRTNDYTKDSLNQLKKALDQAEAVYQAESATQEQVQEQTEKLAKAITALVSQSGSSSDNKDPKGDQDNQKPAENLDVQNLSDGVYSVTGNMLKTDKKTASMSDEAINHTVKLTVEKGSYSLTLNFKGLKINGQQGYLGDLQYFRTGYSTDAYGSPQGSVENVTVNSVQKKSDGSKVQDHFGTDYPDEVTFPLIGEAKKDGWVPLQVFVPIMDSISKGTGTQAVYLKLDWGTLKKTNADDAGFKDDDSNDNNGRTNTSGNTLSDKLNGLNTMQTGSLFGNNSALSNTSLTGSLGSGSKLGSSNSKLSTGSALKSSGNTSLKKSATKTLLSKEGGSDFASSVNNGESSAGTSTTAKSTQAKMMVPSILSVIAALSGIFYKMKSRRKIS